MAMNFWKWLFKVSPNNASNPNPSPSASDGYHYNVPANGSQPIEISVEQESIIGSCLSLGVQDSIGRGANGQLVRSRNKDSVLCGCGHPVSQLHAENEPGKPRKRGMAGKCFYCSKEYQKLRAKGLISEIEAERLSWVCSDCARLTISGVLCCPQHYAAVEDGNGGVIYLGPDEQEQQKRKETLQKILAPFAALFIVPNQPQLPQPEDDDDQDN
jgi:phage pi2 protein 07